MNAFLAFSLTEIHDFFCRYDRSKILYSTAPGRECSLKLEEALLETDQKEKPPQYTLTIKSTNTTVDF